MRGLRGWLLAVVLLSAARLALAAPPPRPPPPVHPPSPQAYRADEVKQIRAVLLGAPDCAKQLPLARQVLVRHGDLRPGSFANAPTLGEGAEAGDAAQVVRRCGSAADVPLLGALVGHPNDYARLHAARALVTHGARGMARAFYLLIAAGPSPYYVDRARFEGWLLDEKCREPPGEYWADWRTGLAEAPYVPECVATRARVPQQPPDAASPSVTGAPR